MLVKLSFTSTFCPCVRNRSLIRSVDIVTVKQFIKQNGKSGRFRLESFGIWIKDGLANIICINEAEFNLKEKDSPKTTAERFFFGETIVVSLNVKSEVRNYEVSYENRGYDLLFVNITKI